MLPQTAILLLERIWLATPLSAAKAVRAAFLRAAGALVSAAHSAEPLNGETASSAVTALARGVMGVCQEALIGQDLPAAPAQLPRTPTTPPAHSPSCSAKFQAAAQPVLAAGSPAAGSNGVLDSRTGIKTGADAVLLQSQEQFRDNSREGSASCSADPVSVTAGADGADMMRSVFLKEAALLYFSPAMQRLAGSGSTGVGP